MHLASIIRPRTALFRHHRWTLYTFYQRKVFVGEGYTILEALVKRYIHSPFTHVPVWYGNMGKRGMDLSSPVGFLFVEAASAILHFLIKSLNRDMFCISLQSFEFQNYISYNKPLLIFLFFSLPLLTKHAGISHSLERTTSRKTFFCANSRGQVERVCTNNEIRVWPKAPEDQLLKPAMVTPSNHNPSKLPEERPEEANLGCNDHS